MVTLKMKGTVDKDGKMSLTLPSWTSGNEVEVIVLVEEGGEKAYSPPKVMSDESFAELLNFHKGQSLDGITLKELKEEGRR